jgi:hypothetical protein
MVGGVNIPARPLVKAVQKSSCFFIGIDPAQISDRFFSVT